ncbi:MAG: DUF2267 domain-containing protein [Pseudorhodoplanes sp.]|nr:DUF2267 domain-containing protein [Pseudorhodoplanes sp.]
MDELIGRLAADTGIDRDVAAQAIGIMLAFLVKEGPSDKVQPLLDQIPGAAAAAQEQAGKLGMGGVMGAGMALMSLGLSMPEVQSVSRSVMAYARETIGEDKVGQLVDAIPGLGQFV